MQRGRPPVVEDQLIERLRSEGRSTLDLSLDRDWLLEMTSDPAALARNLRRKGILHTLQRGRYALNLDRTSSEMPRIYSLPATVEAILRRLEVDYYLSWHSALWFHGLVDQQSRITWVALPNHRKRSAHLGDYEIRFVSVTEGRFFGADDYLTPEGRPVKVASAERAIVDSFDRPNLAAPVSVIANAMRDAWRRGILDPERLVETAIRFDSMAVNRRLGFFMDLYEMPHSEKLESHLGRKSAVPLVAGRQRSAVRYPVDRRWRVYTEPRIINAALNPK